MYQWILFFLQIIGLVFLGFILLCFIFAYNHSLRIVKSISSKNEIGRAHV